MANFLEKSLKLVLIFGFIVGCNSKNSLNTASYSDNKTFQKRGFASKEPYKPFGGLEGEKEEDQNSFNHYQEYVDDGYADLSENEEYFLWLASKRRERLIKGKLNGFNQETMPGLNEYYIKRTRMSQGKTLLNERFYRDIEAQMYKARYRKKDIKQIETVDPIDDYKILNNDKSFIKKESVSEEDYKKSF